MENTRKLWLGLATLLIASFAVLLWAGGEIFRAAPPIPERVVDTTGATVYTRHDIERGRQVWQSMGGMQLGSIWGHGGYVAPDWSADWLHREATALLDQWARAEGSVSYAQLPAERQAALRGRLQEQFRANTYDASTGVITLSRERVIALSNVAAHYESLFGNDPATAQIARGLRDEGRHGARRGEPPVADGLLLVDRVGRGHRTAGRRDARGGGGRRGEASDLHQQLAERAFARQHASGVDVGVVGLQRAVPDRGHRLARLAPRADACAWRETAHDSFERSDGHAARDAVDARHGEVFLGGARAVPRADPARRDDGALPGRRPAGLRLRDLRHPAVLDHPHLAYAVGGVVDRRRVAGHGPVHRTGDVGPRAEVPAIRRQRALGLPADHRRRFVRGPMAGGDAEARAGPQFLVGPPGLGIRGHGPLLAVVPVRRPVAVVDPRRPRVVAGVARPAHRHQGRSSGCCSSPPCASACSSAPR